MSTAPTPARRRTRWIVSALVIVAALLIGYAAGSLTPRLSTPGDDSAEAGFARDMSEHHNQAIEMGMIAFQKATLPEVRTLGRDVALTQKDQVGRMATWLQDWGLSPNTTRAPMSWMPEGTAALNGNLMPGMATTEEMTKLRDATGTEVDILFCQYLLRHHLGGIHMVDGILAKTKNEQVRALAERMKAGQSAEVKVLTDLLTRLGAKPL